MSVLDEIQQLLKHLTQQEKLQLIEMVTASLKEETSPRPSSAVLADDLLDEDDEGNINPLTRRYRYLPNRSRLFEEGVLQIGDRIYIRGHESEIAEFINPNEVTYNNKILKLDAWAALISGQKNINVYKWCILEREGETLDALRVKHLGK